MSVRYVLRRGKLADVIQANLKEAELCYTTDTKQIFVGTEGAPKDIVGEAVSGTIAPYIAQAETYTALAQESADSASASALTSTTASNNITTLISQGESDINTAKTNALTEVNSAWNSAVSDIYAEEATSISAISTAKTNALTDMATTKDGDITSINSAGDTAIADITTATTNAINSVTSAKDNAFYEIGLQQTNSVNRVHSEQRTAVSAIQIVRTEAITSIQSAQATAEGSIATLLASCTSEANRAKAEADRAEGYADELLTLGALDSLTDVTITTPTDGQIVKYDTATGTWVNGEGATEVDLSAIKKEINTVNSQLSTPSLEEMATIKSLYNNKLRFIPADTQEQSTDGSTWTASTRASTTQLKNLMLGQGGNASVEAIPITATGQSGYYRLTWNYASTGLGYVFLNAFYTYCNPAGNDVTFTIEALTDSVWTTIVSGTGTGYPAHVYIPHTAIQFTAGQCDAVRVTLGVTSSETATSVTLGSIEWLGAFPASNPNPETYDYNKNVTFPAWVMASYFQGYFVGNCSGNSATATKATQDANGNVINTYYSPVGHTHVPTVASVTISASIWSTDTYTISNVNITANSVITIVPASTMTSTQYDAIGGAKIIESSISAGQVVLKALGTVPTIDCPIVLVIEG